MASPQPKTNLVVAISLSAISIVATIWSLSSRVLVPGTTASDIPDLLGRSMLLASGFFAAMVWLTIVYGLRLTSLLKLERIRFALILLVGLVAWYLAVLYLGDSGFFSLTPLWLPNIMYGFALLYWAGKYLLSRPLLQQIAAALPVHYIMNVQIFRVMGVVFLMLYAAQLLPGLFAIPTGLGDIAIGVTGPLIAYVYALQRDYSKKLAILWHKLGAGDLTLALSLAIISYSRPLQLGLTNIPSDPVALFPLAMIPLFAVPLSILLHFFSIQALENRP